MCFARHRADSVVALAARSNVARLLEQCCSHRPASRLSSIDDGFSAAVQRVAQRRACRPRGSWASARSRHRGAQPEVDTVMAGDRRRRGSRLRIGRGRGQADPACEQGSAGHVAGPLFMRARARAGDADADRQRAQRDLPVPAGRRACGRRAPGVLRITASGGPFLRAAAKLATASRPSRPARIRAGSWAARSRWIPRR